MYFSIALINFLQSSDLPNNPRYFSNLRTMNTLYYHYYLLRVSALTVRKEKLKTNQNTTEDRIDLPAMLIEHTPTRTGYAV
jgi:hypothetical protein